MSNVKRYKADIIGVDRLGNGFHYSIKNGEHWEGEDLVLASDYDTLLIDVNTLNAAIEGLRETNREQRKERDGLVAALSRLMRCEKFDDDDERLIVARQQASDVLRAVQR